MSFNISSRKKFAIWTKHADIEQRLKAWYKETEKTEWKNINDLKKFYPSARVAIKNIMESNKLEESKDKGFNSVNIIVVIAYSFIRLE